MRVVFDNADLVAWAFAHTLALFLISGVATAQMPSEDAVARARKTAAMLDDIYKNAVVLITDRYVNDEDDFAAGAAAVQLFKTISDKGWHTVRLIDATGDPYDSENVAKDDF